MTNSFTLDPARKELERALAAGRAAALTKEIERLKTALKLSQDELKKIVEEQFEGSLRLGDEIWGKFPSVSWKGSSEVVRMLCAALAIDNVDPYEYISITEANLKKIRKEKGLDINEEFMENIGFKKSIIMRFDNKKADSEE
ncbi:hypothetical protein LJR153_007363 [Paenibacillus sp. LjRoot153]|uniref:hypothetical protein n=1 Tax=Paenibacillus sp. LjRoot153 TaxID=3342270 RepID=UPI003ED0BC2D